jgi:general secretion pathway protein D
VIGQRKISHDIRMPEGAVQLLGGITSISDTKTKTGIPGLASIPLLGRLFSGDSIDHERSELMIALIPHIVRRPEYSAEMLRAIAVGTAASTKINYATSPISAPLKKEAPAVTPAVTPAPTQPVPPPAVTTPQPPMAAATTPQPPAPRPGLMPPATAPPLDAMSNPITPAAAATSSLAKPEIASAPGKATVRLLPPQVELTSQGTTTVALIIENAADAASGTLQLAFNPKIVKLNDVGRGDLFSSDGQVPNFSKSIQNDAGSAVVNLNRLPGTTGVSGSGVLATFVFQAVAKGTASVTIPNLTVRNSQGQVIYTGTPQTTLTVK